MVKDSKILERFEKNLVRRSKSEYKENVKIANDLLAYAKKMRKFPPKNRLEGIEVDIKFAKVINSVR